MGNKNFLYGEAIIIVLIALVPGVISSLSRGQQLHYVGQHGNYSWPRRELSVSMDGDIVLGALHMVHERSEEYTCGAVMNQGGIQALETMLYTLDFINQNEYLLPSVTLGILAKDDCDRDIYGLEQAVDFIRGKYQYIFYIHSLKHFFIFVVIILM